MTKIIYIAGPIIEKEKFWAPFELAEEDIRKSGFIPLNPSTLYKPEMSNEQFMKIRLALIDSADGVYFISSWFDRPDTMQERRYSEAIGKPCNSRLATLTMELK